MQRIIIVESRDVVRAGLCSIVQRHSGYEVVAEATDGKQAIMLALAAMPDVLLIDAALPDFNGIVLTERVARELPQARVIILSDACDDHALTAALKAGAKGFVLMETAAIELGHALSATEGGGTYFSPIASTAIVNAYLNVSEDENGRAAELTSKQREVLKLLVEGKSNKEVARAMHVSCKTIKAHRAQIMSRLNIRHLPGLTKYAIRTGLASL